MMYFYAHLIQIEPLLQELEELNLTNQQKHHLAALIDSHIHHNVMDLILSELTDQDKQLLLEKLADKKAGAEILEYLESKSAGIEYRIKSLISEVKNELHTDVKESKKIK